MLLGLLVAPGVAYASATEWDEVDSSCGLQVLGGTPNVDYRFEEVTYTRQDRPIGGAFPGGPYTVKTLRILTSTPLTIKNKNQGAATDTSILIDAGVNATITLDGVNISSATPFNMVNPPDNADKSSLTLILADGSTNTINAIANYYSPAIRVPKNASLIIDDSVRNIDVNGNYINHNWKEDWENPEHWGKIPEDTVYEDHNHAIRTAKKEDEGSQELALLDSLNPGKLIAYGGMSSAVIGGGPVEDTGPITIDGGNIEVYPYKYAIDDHADYDSSGSGIGTGMGGVGTGLTINGGNILAYGSIHGAGIGSGSFYQNGFFDKAAYRFADAIGGVLTNTNEQYDAHAAYPNTAVQGYCAVPGDIYINGGYIRSIANSHGHAFGHGCYSTNKGHKIVVMGGTLLPSSTVPGWEGFYPYDIGSKDCPVYVFGGSVRVTDNKYQALIGDVEVHDRAYGPKDNGGNYTEVMMCVVDLSSQLGNKTGSISVLDAKISGIPQSYGMPACTDDMGKLYLWLPKIEGATRIEVDLRVVTRDAEGNESEVKTTPFYIESSKIDSGALLKQYVEFTIDDGPLRQRGLLDKRYDGTQLNPISDAIMSLTDDNGAVGIPVTVPEDGRLTDPNTLSFETTAIDKNGNSLGRPTTSGLPVNAGYSSITVYSTQYATDPQFSNSFWGHKSQVSPATITPAESMTDVTGARVTGGGETALAADGDGNVINVSAADTLRFTAHVRPYYTVENGEVVTEGTRTITNADGTTSEVPLSEAKTCAAPEGEVEFLLSYTQADGTTKLVSIGTGALTASPDKDQYEYNYSTASVDLHLADKDIHEALGGTLPDEFTVVAKYKAQDSGRQYVINYNASAGQFPAPGYVIHARPCFIVSDRTRNYQGFYDVTSAALVNQTAEGVPTSGALADSSTGGRAWAEGVATTDGAVFIGWTDNPRTDWNTKGTDRVIEDWETVGTGVKVVYPVFRSSGSSVGVAKGVSIPEGYAVMRGGTAHPHLGGKLHYAVTPSTSGIDSATTMTFTDRLPAQVVLDTGTVRLTYADGSSTALTWADALGEGAFTYDEGTRELVYRSSDFDLDNLPTLEFDVNIASLVDDTGTISRIIRNGATVSFDGLAGRGSCEAPLVLDPPRGNSESALLACWREAQAGAADSGPNYPKLGYFAPNLVVGERILQRTPQVASVTGYDALYAYYPASATGLSTGGSTTAAISANDWALVRAASGGPMPNDSPSTGVVWEFVGWTDNPYTSWNPRGTERIIEEWETVPAGTKRIYPVYRRGSVGVTKTVSIPEGYGILRNGVLHPYLGGKLHYAVTPSVSGPTADFQTLTFSDHVPAQVTLDTGSVRLTYRSGTSVALSLSSALAEGLFTYNSETRELVYRTSQFTTDDLPTLEFDVTITSLLDEAGNPGRYIRNGATVRLDDWLGHGSCVTPLVFDGTGDTDAILLACWREAQAGAADSGPNYPKLGYVAPNLVIWEPIIHRTPEVASLTGYGSLYDYYPAGASDPGLQEEPIAADKWAVVRAADGGPMPDDDPTSGVYWAWLGWTDDPRTSWNPTGTDRLLSVRDLVRPGVSRVYPVYGRSGAPVPDGWPPEPPDGYRMDKDLLNQVDQVTIFQELEFKVAALDIDLGKEWDSITITDRIPEYTAIVPGSVRLAVVDYGGPGRNGTVAHEYPLQLADVAGRSAFGTYSFDADHRLMTAHALKAWMNDGTIQISNGQSLELRFKIYVTRDWLRVSDRSGELVNEGWVTWYPPVPEGEDPTGYPPIWVGHDEVVLPWVVEDEGRRWITKESENLTRPGERVRVGDRLRYSIVAGNDKGYRWEGVILRDVLPAGLEVDASTLRIYGPDGVEHKIDPKAWNEVTHTIVVSGGSLEPGERVRLVFEVTVGNSAANKEADIGNVATAGGWDPWGCPFPPPIGEPVEWPWGEGSEGGDGVDVPVSSGVCYPPNTPAGPVPYADGSSVNGIPRTEDPFVALAGVLPALAASGATSLAGGTALRRQPRRRGKHSK